MATLDGKVAVITGASSGIGEAAALLFGREGAKVVVAARREDKGQAVVSQVQSAGGEAMFVKTDVTKREDIEGLIDTSNDFIDCRVTTQTGIDLATLQASQQFKLYTGLEFPL